ncbi:hypothetical protein Bb109J_c2511 [Bdellovibrio bacteriovorus]|uniref:hypothetical protein n=2 Tax=Bdellovibrio bacteriovorus TaxID=959 RepID=UPI000A900586|nr:hypothetical protein [Bdellovibrio bacteriovorus]BEV69091.1 hypothetical protein Bb109J_c2511 [Bdellovibrio bacteriovorus]
MKHLKMSLNIVIAASLLTAVACSNSGKSTPGSNELELTGYWKGECYTYPVRTTEASEFEYFEITADGTQKRFTAQFTSTDCTGEASQVHNNGSETFEIGTILSESPWTAELNYTRCNGDSQAYATLKYETELLHLATGECGSSVEDRCTDFSEGTTYSRLAEEDVPPYTEPVKITPKLCLQ